jgi:hypothetical protein
MASEKSRLRISDDEVLVRARSDFDRCQEAWRDNQRLAREDLKFARLGEQWPEAIKKQRELEQRPCLTFNKMTAFIRQVVNDARQNKPQIKIHPLDSSADPEVAIIINGLIRNIETASDADVAYDTAVEQAVGQGFGFWRINTRYTCDDAFDQDIVIERITNPFSVFGDPRSAAADSSDWNVAFVITALPKAEFEREYPEAEKTDWDHDFKNAPEWISRDDVTVAEYWTREKVRGQIVALSDGTVRKLEEVERLAVELVEAGINVIGQPRDVETYKVTQRIMSGAEILKTVEWAGKYIPIVPVYGDEVIDDDGKRWFRSLIRDGKDAQRMFNYWRSTTTELVALAPKAPFIGEEGSFDVDPNWNNVNDVTLAKLEYKRGASRPERQPFSGVPAGALQEALNANDDMKAIIGIYDASLGARSNEISGRAIMARQREGDVSTFHFLDNLSRAIRHGGRIILDLIGKVYTTERVVRILGEDLAPQTAMIAPTGQPVTPRLDGQGNVTGKIFDITAGKYDLTVKAGPSFTSMREESRLMMQEAIQAGGDAVVPVLLPEVARLMDWPNADQIAAKLDAQFNPSQSSSPELQQRIQASVQRLQQLEDENQALTSDYQAKLIDVQLKGRELDIKEREVGIKELEARAKLMRLSSRPLSEHRPPNLCELPPS